MFVYKDDCIDEQKKEEEGKKNPFVQITRSFYILLQKATRAPYYPQQFDGG
jgi:hypothetical protein